MKHLSILILAVAFLNLADTAQAYVPTTQFIFDRMSEQHGKGSYIIDMETIFKEGLETVVIKENWFVNDGGDMRLFAQGDGVKLLRILKKGRVYWVDQTGSERADEATSDYFMSPLLTRSSADQKKFFIRWKVLPPEALREKRTPKDLKDIQYTPEPFVRLGRVGGAVAWFYGQPTPPNSKPQPGLWIEQDTFLIRKMRSPTGAELQANDYAAYSKNLWFPKNQTYVFDNHVVNVRVTRVQARDLSNDQKRQMDPSWLRARPDVTTQWSQSVLAPVIQEFYKRFR